MTPVPDPLADLLAAIRAFSETSAPINFVPIPSHWDIFLQAVLNTVVNRPGFAGG